MSLLKLIKAEGATATPADRAACTAKYNSVIREGVSGPLTLISWKEFLKRERKAKMHLPPGERPSAEAEMANFTTIGFYDPDFRQTFNLEVRLQRPTPPLDLTTSRSSSPLPIWRCLRTRRPASSSRTCTTSQTKSSAT